MKNILIIGAGGQLGKALSAQYPKAQGVDIDELNIGEREAVQSFDWSGIEIIINAAAYTNVDGAETLEGRVASWQANATAPRNLAEIAIQHSMTLVHVSSDYVFDGTQENHTEHEPFSPLSVYGASKAAGDIAVSTVPKHYILRTSWLIGKGKNFVRTMLELGSRGVNPTVVDDQIGRLTFTAELVRAVDFLLKNNTEPGTYNVTNEGPSKSWADIARDIFAFTKLSNTVNSISTADYFANKEHLAPRPLKSTLGLKKLQNTGFQSRDWQDDLKEYIEREKQI